MPNNTSSRDRDIADLIDAYEALMHRLSSAHAPVFAEVDLTMAQAKALYVVLALGRPRMSDIAARLRVSLSTASEVVDRLVALGLLVREADPGDRRHVILTATSRAAAVIERFRELGLAQLRELLARVTDEELGIIRRSVDVLDRAAREAASSAAAPPADIPPSAQRSES